MFKPLTLLPSSCPVCHRKEQLVRKHKRVGVRLGVARAPSLAHRAGGQRASKLCDGMPDMRLHVVHGRVGWWSDSHCTSTQ